MAAMNKHNTKVDYYKDYGYEIVVGGFVIFCVVATFMTFNF